MRYKFVGKNIDVGNRLKDRLTKKIGKLEKFFNPDTEAVATFSIIKNSHIFELTITQNGVTFRAEERSDDMYVSIDKAVDVVERQLRKNKTRLARRIHDSAFKSADIEDDVSYVIEESDYKIARTKKYPVKPVSIEEAILQMNLLGHDFFVFTNTESKDVNVVYRRKDESYGLIEPGE